MLEHAPVGAYRSRTTKAELSAAMSAPSDPAVTANPSALPYATAEVRPHHPFAALGTGHHLDRTAHVTHLEPLATCTPRSWSNPTLERTWSLRRGSLRVHRTRPLRCGSLRSVKFVGRARELRLGG